MVLNWRGIRVSRFLSIPESTEEANLAPEAREATMAKCKCSISQIKTDSNISWIKCESRRLKGGIQVGFISDCREVMDIAGASLDSGLRSFILTKINFHPAERNQTPLSPVHRSLNILRISEGIKTDLFWHVNSLVWPFLTTWIDDIY